jgi:hypothetical protein
MHSVFLIIIETTAKSKQTNAKKKTEPALDYKHKTKHSNNKTHG